MILEIWSATDRVYCNFGPFFCPFTPLKTNKIKILKKNDKPWKYYDLYKSTKNAIHMMYGSWDKKHNRENFLPFLGQFLPFYLTNNPKNQDFKKMKKIPGDIIILYKCTKNHDHMLYCCWDTVCDGCNVYFSFWAIFCPFSPLEISSFYIL